MNNVIKNVENEQLIELDKKLSYEYDSDIQYKLLHIDDDVDIKGYKYVKNILTVKSVNKRLSFKTGVFNLNFTLREGEYMGLVGPSGSGKTTLIKMLFRTISYDTGSIFIYNNEIKNISRNVLGSYVQTTFQSPKETMNLYKTTVQIFNDVFEISRKKYPFLLYSQFKRQYIELLTQFNLKKRVLNSKLNFLSGGELQRVQLIRSLLVKPNLLFLDEALAALDFKTTQLLLDWFKKRKNHPDIRERFALIFISHNLADVEYLCDKVLFLNNGRIFSIVDKKKIFSENVKFQEYISKTEEQNSEENKFF